MIPTNPDGTMPIRWEATPRQQGKWAAQCVQVMEWMAKAKPTDQMCAWMTESRALDFAKLVTKGTDEEAVQWLHSHGEYQGNGCWRVCSP